MGPGARLTDEEDYFERGLFNEGGPEVPRLSKLTALHLACARGAGAKIASMSLNLLG